MLWFVYLPKILSNNIFKFFIHFVTHLIYIGLMKHSGIKSKYCTFWPLRYILEEMT